MTGDCCVFKLLRRCVGGTVGKVKVVFNSHRVVTNYVQDNVSYVPVQDVVKAFKRDFGVDISYKECHQMILSAYTTPKNRLIPKKNVRVSSIGQQYVYRGIAAIDKPACTSVEAQVMRREIQCVK